MSIGKVARKLLGKRLLPLAARCYRRIFVDLETVVDCVCEWIPENARVLDIGGGDGEPLNLILGRRSDVIFTMIDLSSSIGGAIESKYRDRVLILPSVNLRQYIDHHLGASSPQPSCILVSDVLHHIPVPERKRFFADLRELFVRTHAVVLLKDVEPGSFISWLGYLSDRFVSGDKKVSLISRAELSGLITEAFSSETIADTPLYEIDRPNYLLVVSGSKAKGIFSQ